VFKKSIVFKFLKKDGVRGLGGVVSKLLLPCLIFSNIIKTFNPADTSVWFPILLFISSIKKKMSKFILLVCRLLGMGCGYVLGKILRLTGKNMKFAMTVTGFSHHTSIQLLFIDALQETLNQLKTTIPLPNSIRGYTPYERGIYYVVLNSIVSTFWAWGVAFQ
jgi:predicted permease